MSRLEIFNDLVKLAKGSNNRRMSELSTEEQYAVMFLGNKYPSSLVGGVPKYDKDSKYFTYACSYIEARKMNQALGGENKFQANTFHVFPDLEPTFEEANPLEALETNKIPIKPSQYENLLPLLPNNSVLLHPKTEISAQICRVYAALVNDEKMELNVQATHLAIHKYREQFRELATALKLEALITTILTYKPTLDKRPPGSMTKEESESVISYLPTYIYYASKGIYIKSERKI